MRETYFMSPEALHKELKNYIDNKSFLSKNLKQAENPEDIYIFQPAFIEAFETFLFENNKEKMKNLIFDFKNFIQEAPYQIEEKDELLWALELWQDSIGTSFTKMLNAAKARKKMIHSVIK